MEEEEKKEIFQSPPEFESRSLRTGSGSSAKRYITVVVIIVVIVLILLGVFKFASNSGSKKIEITPTPTQEVLPTDTPTPEVSETPSPTQKPTATPKPSVNPIDKSSGLDRSKLSIHVLNGTSITGAAKKASDFLEGLGYNVVQIGNADNSDYAQTEIQIATAQNKYLDLLKKDLSVNYTIGNTSSDLSASESANVVVIVGKQ